MNQNNGWIKYFTDGTTEEGYDHLIKTGCASWSKGRLDNIRAVCLFQDKSVISMSGTGEFWQSDTYEARFLHNEGILVKRTLYKKLNAEDKWLLTRTHVYQCHCEFLSSYVLGASPIPSHEVGRWFILDLEQDKISWRIEDGAIS